MTEGIYAFGKFSKSMCSTMVILIISLGLFFQLTYSDCDAWLFLFSRHMVCIHTVKFLLRIYWILQILYSWEILERVINLMTWMKRDNFWKLDICNLKWAKTKIHLFFWFLKPLNNFLWTHLLPKLSSLLEITNYSIQMIFEN